MIPAEQGAVLRGELLYDEPMARHTSWRVGGPAARFYRPADARDLAVFLRTLPPREPVLWVGLGSNLLVRDGGFPGTVVATQGRLDGLERVGEHGVFAAAGVACAKVARFAARAGLCGVEFLAGIPGTLGGALAMNAGAFGGETWERVVAVETVDRQGRIRQRRREAFQIAYREIRGPEGEWFLGARMELEAGDAAAAQARIRQLLERRSSTQPTSQPSCGSVFRNPQGDHAARLIEAAGLKGQCVGGACVSEKHANFIVNANKATAADIEALINLVRDRVERTNGVQLTAEVHIVGEAD